MAGKLHDGIQPAKDEMGEWDRMGQLTQLLRVLNSRRRRVFEGNRPFPFAFGASLSLSLFLSAACLCDVEVKKKCGRAGNAMPNMYCTVLYCTKS